MSMLGTREEPSLAYIPGGSCFFLFTRLPIELRLTIWGLNLPRPRIVPIRCCYGNGASQLASVSNEDQESLWRLSGLQNFKCTSSAPIPVNLHVCGESRLDAMKRYKLMFGTKRDPGRVFFDPLRDTLYFGTRDSDIASETQFLMFTKLAEPQDLSLILHVAINETLFWNNDDVPWANPNTTIPSLTLTIHQVLQKICASFPGLAQLTFVCRDRNPVYSPDAVLVLPWQRNRLAERRIGDAVADLMPAAALPPAWVWNIRSIAADPDPPAYDHRILGYGREERGPVAEVEGHFQKRKRSWAGWQYACNSCGDRQRDTHQGEKAPDARDVRAKGG
ncbi:hypothetical protein F4810DRAFT_715980 [Camillea tinctor]|nr:hypothetical protein F4810DRAFT_715980 [Camillea tinctor]